MVATAQVLSAQKQVYHDRISAEPTWYARNVLGVTPHIYQTPILSDFLDPTCRLMAIRSGNSAGKTFALAILAMLFSDLHFPSYTILSGSSWAGVLKTLWATLAFLHRRSIVDLGGRLMTSGEWRRKPMWSVFCVSPDVPENFSGFRVPDGGHVCVIVDEASSLTPEVYEAIRGLCASSNSKLVLSGNPLHLSGPFHDAFKNPDFRQHHINSEDVAKLGIPGLASSEWLEEMKREYGEGTPQYTARVKGDFPASEEDTVIPAEWSSHLGQEPTKKRGLMRLGVDVARYGSDRTVLVLRDDAGVHDVETFVKKGVAEVTGIVKKRIERHKLEPSLVFVDVIGIGAGVVDNLLDDGFAVTPVNFGEGADDRMCYANSRAECYWSMRKAMDPDQNGHAFRIGDWSDLLRETLIPKHRPNRRGQIRIEEKDEIKKRLGGRSPDLVDALALTFGPASSGFSAELV